jgi:hypothetical protein
MNNNLLIELVKLSNSLDDCGLVKEADWVDNLIGSRDRLPIKLAITRRLTVAALDLFVESIVHTGKRSIASRLLLYGAGTFALGKGVMGAWHALSDNEKAILLDAGITEGSLETSDPAAMLNQVVDDMLEKDLVGGLNWTDFPGGARADVKAAFKADILTNLSQGYMTEETLKSLMTKHSGSDSMTTNYEYTEEYTGIFDMIVNVGIMQDALKAVGISPSENEAACKFGFMIGFNTADGEPLNDISEYTAARDKVLETGSLVKPCPNFGNHELWVQHLTGYTDKKKREEEAEEARQKAEEELQALDEQEPNSNTQGEPDPQLTPDDPEYWR